MNEDIAKEFLLQSQFSEVFIFNQYENDKPVAFEKNGKKFIFFIIQGEVAILSR